MSVLRFLGDNPLIFQHWVQIVSLRGVQGKQVHDARLVAVMQVYQIQNLLTFNGSDFRGYSGIIPVDPASVI
jgi:predicted nucleic acid-binding protein